MATIGKVAAVFTASTSGLTSGVKAAQAAFRGLGGSASALASSMRQLQSIKLSGFDTAGVAADTAAGKMALFTRLQESAINALRLGTIDAGQFAAKMEQIATAAASASAVLADGAAVTQQFATAEDVLANSLARYQNLLDKGAISQETFNRAVAASRDSFAAASGQAAANAAALAELQATQARGAEVTRANQTAQESYAATVAELSGLLSAGAISQETFNRAIESAAATLAQSNGTAAAAAAALAELQATQARGAEVTRANQTAQESYAASVAELSGLLSSGAISQETFARASAAASEELARQDGTAAAAAAALAELQSVQSRGAEVTRANQTAQESYAATVAELSGLLSAGAISQETFNRASAAASEELARQDGTAAAAAAAIAELQSVQARGAEVTRANQTAQESYAASVAELSGLLSAGAISQETFNRAVASASSTLAQNNGAAAAAVAAMDALSASFARGAEVTRANMTVEEKYASEIDELSGLLSAGAISQETFNRAAARADDALRGAGAATDSMSESTKGLAGWLKTLIAIEVGKFLVSFASYAASCVRSLLSFGQAQADVVDSSSKLAARLGFTYGEFAGLSLAAELAGVSMDSIGAASQRAEIAFAKAAGGSKTAADAFTAIGLSVDQLNGLSAADRFDAIASSIAALPTEAQRAAAAVRIFGQAGADLLPLFSGGAEGIAAARAEAERLGLTLTNAQGQNVEAMNDSFTMVGKTIQGVVQQVTAFLAPAITAIASQFTKFVGDVGGATIGQRIGEGILEGAKFIAAVGDAVIAGFASVFDYLSQVGGQWSSVWAIGARVGAILEGGFRTGQLILNAIGGFLSDVVSSLFSAAAQLAEIVPGFGEFAAELNASSDRWAATADGFAASADASLAAAGQAFATAIDGPLAQSGQAIAGPLTAGLRSAIAQAQQAASAVDTASKKPVDVKQTVTVDVKEAIKGIDSRSSEGIAEMYRIIRGDTGNVQEQQLAALEEIAANTSDFEPLPAVAID